MFSSTAMLITFALRDVWRDIVVTSPIVPALEAGVSGSILLLFNGGVCDIIVSGLLL